MSRRFGLYEDLRPAEKRKTRVAGVARPTVPLTYLYDEDGLAHTWVGGRTDTSVNNVSLYSAAGGDKKSKPVELGRKAIVKRIAEDLPAGSHVLTWSGRNDDGALAAPGVYFLRLKAGDYMATRRVVRIQ